MTLEEMRRERGALSALPNSEGRSERTRALLRRAEEAGHTSLALSLRLELLNLEILLVGRTAPEDRGPRSDRMRLDFTRVLALHDRHPEHFGVYEESVLWDLVDHFVCDLLERAAAPVTHLTALLDDLERRFSPTGENLTTFLAARHQIANHVGDLDTADALIDRIRRMEWSPVWALRDFVQIRVHTLSARGLYERAVEAARPLLEGEVRSVDPDGSPTDLRPLLLDLLNPYLRTGRLAEARRAYRRTVGLVGSREAQEEGYHWRTIEDLIADQLSARLSFYSLSGNEDRALALLRRTPPALGPVHDHARLTLATGVALACRRLAETGRGHETVEAVSEGAPRAISVADLHQDQADHAMRFAFRADECNGNDYRSRTVHEHIHLRPVVDHLDLGTEGAPGPPTGPESADDES